MSQDHVPTKRSLCLIVLDIYAAIDEISGEGFGKILPALRSSHKEETEEEEEDDEIPSEFVSKRELEKSRVSHKGDFITINFFYDTQ